MRVKLRNQLFIVDRLFERGEYGPNSALGDFPDELKKHLPKSAQTKFDGDETAEPAPAEADYRDMDLARGASDELAKIEADADEREKRRIANRAKIQAKLAAET